MNDDETFDRFVAYMSRFPREMWEFLTARTYTPLDVLILLALIAATKHGAPNWLLGCGALVWICLRRR